MQAVRFPITWQKLRKMTFKVGDKVILPGYNATPDRRGVINAPAWKSWHVKLESGEIVRVPDWYPQRDMG